MRLTNDIKCSLDNASGLGNHSVRRSVSRVHPFVTPHLTTHDVPDESVQQVGILNQRSSSFLGGECSISPNYCDYNSPRSDLVALPLQIVNWSLRHSTLEKRHRTTLSSSSSSSSDDDAVMMVDDAVMMDDDVIMDSDTDEEEAINPPLVRQVSDLPAVIVDCTNQESSEEDNESAPDSVVSSVDELSPPPPPSSLVRPCSVVVAKLPLTTLLRQNLNTDSAAARGTESSLNSPSSLMAIVDSGEEQSTPTTPNSTMSDFSDNSRKLSIAQNPVAVSTPTMPLAIPLEQVDIGAACSAVDHSEEDDQSSIGDTGQ